MKVLIVASYNKKRFVPFIVEQVDALRAAGVEIEYFGVMGKGLLGYLKARKGLMQKIQEFKPDIIHAHYGLSGLLANLQRRVPVVTTYHGSDINVPKVLRFSKMAMRLSAFNIFVSKRNIQIALGVKNQESGVKKNYMLLPCGIDVDNFTPRTREEAREALGWGMDEQKVLFAGAFDNAVKNAELAKQAINYLNKTSRARLADRSEQSEDKNYRELDIDHEAHKLNEVHELNDMNSRPCLDAAADSSELDHQPLNNIPESNELDSVAEPDSYHNDTNDNTYVELVELKGFSRAEVANLFYAADALVMTSFTEGSPQVVKEAMACGCPIVSVDVGDVAERIAGVDKCYIAERSPEDIAQKLQLALQTTDRTNGQKQLLEMGLDNKQVAKKLIEIYTTILNESKH